MTRRTRMAALGGVAAMSAVALSAACDAARLDILAPPDGGPSGLADDGGLTADVALETGVLPGRADYCSGSGPPILVGDHEGGTTSACAGGIARSAFRYALCTCEGLVSAKAIVTDSFDSHAGPYDPGTAHAGGGLGTNGSFNANGPLTIGGALWASDSTGMTTSADSVTKGELHVNGRVQSGTLLSVGGDAFVNGDLLATGQLTIQGTLHQPAGKTVNAGTKSIGATATGPVNVPPACDCDPALLVDVAAFVEAYRAKNDDQTAGIDPRALENVGTDTSLTIPCGRIFFTRVGGSGAIHLTLSAGRTALFIGGDLSPSGAFSIDVPAASELDLFVEGNVSAQSTFMIGGASNPSNARLYVGGNGTINLIHASTIAGNVYGPRAEMVLGGDTTVYGAIFARRLSSQGALTIHYDEGVLSKGSDCPSPTTPCTSCHDCGNQACNAGSCGACTDSSECCAPLQCSSGRCVPQIK